MDRPGEARNKIYDVEPYEDETYEDETYNPWSVVNLVFHHLVDEGLHPVLGGPGDPGGPATELLRALGITPTPEGNRRVVQDARQRLADLRSAAFGQTELP
jgi:hypothetical protein